MMHCTLNKNYSLLKTCFVQEIEKKKSFDTLHCFYVDFYSMISMSNDHRDLKLHIKCHSLVDANGGFFGGFLGGDELGELIGVLSPVNR